MQEQMKLTFVTRIHRTQKCFKAAHSLLFSDLKISTIDKLRKLDWNRSLYVYYGRRDVFLALSLFLYYTLSMLFFDNFFSIFHLHCVAWHIHTCVYGTPTFYQTNNSSESWLLLLFLLLDILLIATFIEYLLATMTFHWTKSVSQSGAKRGATFNFWLSTSSIFQQERQQQKGDKRKRKKD